MAKFPALRSEREINDSLKAGLEDRAGITVWSPDSIGSILSDTLSRELAHTNAEADRSFQAIQVSTAAGSDLDAIGREWSGITRKQATRAGTTYQERNIMFYSTNGTFGDINGGVDIVIPAGTEITTSKAVNGVEVFYRTDREYTLPAGETTGYCSAHADEFGAASNVAEGALSRHGFDDYVLSNYDYLKCTNKYPVLNGSEQEEDDTYRFRVLQRIPSLVQSNIANVNLRALEVPGVEEVRIMPGYFGVGTAAVIVFGIDNETSPALVRSVQQNINYLQGPGLSIQAIGGVKVYFDLELRCRVSKAFQSVSRDVLKRTIRLETMEAIKEQEYQRTISFPEIAERVIQNVQMIEGLVSNNTSTRGFESVYVKKAWANSGVTGFSRTKLLVSSFDLEADESASIGDVSIVFVES